MPLDQYGSAPMMGAEMPQNSDIPTEEAAPEEDSVQLLHELQAQHHATQADHHEKQAKIHSKHADHHRSMHSKHLKHAKGGKGDGH